MDIPLEQLHPYARQPYAVDRKTPDLARLMDSIEENGINTPLIVRPREAGGYEILSGHRRNYCAGVLGLQTLPAIVRNMDDEKADELVVDANINREDLLPSEKAKAYKLKLDAMKRQGSRTDLTSLQFGEKLNKTTSVQLLSEQVKENSTNIQRFIRLTNLIPELLSKVDDGSLKLVAASDFISHLTETEQSMLNAVMERDEVSPSMGQAQRLKQLSAMGMLDEAAMDALKY